MVATGGNVVVRSPGKDREVPILAKMTFADRSPGRPLQLGERPFDWIEASWRLLSHRPRPILPQRRFNAFAVANRERMRRKRLCAVSFRPSHRSDRHAPNGRPVRDQSAVHPPSTTIEEPVIRDDASDARRRIAPIKSSTSPTRPSLILVSTSASTLGSLRNRSASGV
jgi:hypothetical protein